MMFPSFRAMAVSLLILAGLGTAMIGCKKESAPDQGEEKNGNTKKITVNVTGMT